jgi:hypothetical protein
LLFTPHRVAPDEVEDRAPGRVDDVTSDVLRREQRAAAVGRERGVRKMSHPVFRGRKPEREIKCVLGSSPTHMMTHGTETNVTTLIYNGVLYKIVK